MTKLFFQIAIITTILHFTRSSEDRYIRYVKDSCFIKGEALACVKYKALKIAKNTIFGDVKNNETIVANDVISFVPLEENVNEVTLKDDDAIPEGPRGFLSEWSEIAKYFVSLVKEFFKMRGLRINLPPGARTIEEGDSKDDGRGKKKRLAIMIPFLNLLATLKTKMLLIPILLGVMLIKKLLLVAALLLPSLFSTLKACKQHHPSTHYSYFGSDSSDYNSDYANNYAYSSGGGYGKDWASNRAYTAPKHRPTAAPVYITAPGNVA
ncbi:uncharacterized protein LOC126980057 [Leptidea sinapis]|uniref:uncharacterized protein LOC126980057 n=1 Tax=Leptidea sinapis TaxID=189913 RepID=UPI0021C493B8|nr:uncharacterized protein LOC126980057 [Leptidea sinapis]